LPRPYIPSVLRAKVAEDARHRCGYCLTSQLIAAMPLHVEHIIPLAVGGNSDEANLWLACPLCNGFKGSQTHHPDPETGEAAPLFNPRWQSWSEHFQWSAGGVEIQGLTPTGRATVVALKLNNEHLTQARRRWVLVGWHSPTA